MSIKRILVDTLVLPGCNRWTTVTSKAVQLTWWDLSTWKRLFELDIRPQGRNICKQTIQMQVAVRSERDTAAAFDQQDIACSGRDQRLFHSLVLSYSGIWVMLVQEHEGKQGNE